MGRNDDQIRCSFCNKSQAQVKKLIAGPNDTYICDECVEVCSEIIEEEMAYDENDSWTPFSDINLLKPEEIKEFLDGRCAGKILPFPKANGTALIQVHAGKQGERVYAEEGRILWSNVRDMILLPEEKCRCRWDLKRRGMPLRTSA